MLSLNEINGEKNKVKKKTKINIDIQKDFSNFICNHKTGQTNLIPFQKKKKRNIIQTLMTVV